MSPYPRTIRANVLQAKLQRFPEFSVAYCKGKAGNFLPQQV
jgi:hypothetical protein